MTQYRLALTPRDYRACHAFMRENDMKPTQVKFPTIMAERAGKMVGMFGTYPSEDAIVAGPLLLAKDTPSPFVKIKMAEYYEAVLAKAGVARYVFWCDEDDEKALTMVRKLGYKEFAHVGKAIWFEKVIRE